MRARTSWAAAAALAALVVSAAGAAETGSPAGAGAAPKVTRVTLGIRHRVFPSFGEKVTVRMQERFEVGDTEYSGQLVQFLPHFDYDIKKRKAVSLSNQLKNPAFQVIVRKKGVPQDTAWCFLNSPPHFARKSMLAFRVLEIEFADHAPLIGDTTSTAPPAAPSAPAAK